LEAATVYFVGFHSRAIRCASARLAQHILARQVERVARKKTNLAA
jgi:hypothetical protein